MTTAKRRSEHASTLVFTATYNERDNIEAFVDSVLKQSRDYDLLVVDDASPDGTGQCLEQLRQQYGSRLQIVHRPRKLGLGSAHKLAMLHSVELGYQQLVTMDADFSHDPAEIATLVAKLEDADFATGSRYTAGGRCDYRGYRRVVSLAANTAARLLLGIPLHEFTTSFRAFRVALLRELDVSSIKSQGYSFFLESVYRIARHGARVAEMAIHFHDRLAGQSKIPRLEILRGMSTLLRLVGHRLSRRRQPTRLTPGGHCPLCDETYIVEQYPARLSRRTRATAVEAARAYQCTSMDHDDKPPVAACLSCGLHFVPHARVPQDLDEIYADVVDDTYLENLSGRERTFARAYRSIAPHIDELRGDARPGRLLEIGSYCGVFLDIARRHGWQVCGVEPSRWASKWAREHYDLPVHTGTIADARFAHDQRFDVVVLWDVLEHIADPDALLRQVHNVLAPNGIICLSTLDIDSWYPRLLGRRWPWYMSMHLIYFSTETMREFFVRAGYQLRQASTYSHYISVRYLFDKLATLAPRAIAWLFRLTRVLAPKSLFVRFHFGDIKLFIAQCAPVATPERVPDVTAEPIAAIDEESEPVAESPLR